MSVSFPPPSTAVTTGSSLATSSTGSSSSTGPSTAIATTVSALASTSIPPSSSSSSSSGVRSSPLAGVPAEDRVALNTPFEPGADFGTPRYKLRTAFGVRLTDAADHPEWQVEVARIIREQIIVAIQKDASYKKISECLTIHRRTLRSSELLLRDLEYGYVTKTSTDITKRIDNRVEYLIRQLGLTEELNIFGHPVTLDAKELASIPSLHTFLIEQGIDIGDPSLLLCQRVPHSFSLGRIGSALLDNKTLVFYNLAFGTEKSYISIIKRDEAGMGHVTDKTNPYKPKRVIDVSSTSSSSASIPGGPSIPLDREVVGFAPSTETVLFLDCYIMEGLSLEKFMFHNAFKGITRVIVQDSTFAYDTVINATTLSGIGNPDKALTIELRNCKLHRGGTPVPLPGPHKYVRSAKPA